MPPTHHERFIIVSQLVDLCLGFMLFLHMFSPIFILIWFVPSIFALLYLCCARFRQTVDAVSLTVAESERKIPMILWLEKFFDKTFYRKPNQALWKHLEIRIPRNRYHLVLRSFNIVLVCFAIFQSVSVFSLSKRKERKWKNKRSFLFRCLQTNILKVQQNKK